MTVHFRPPSGYVGDLIPFERDGRLWLFYLLDERCDPPTGMPWALASTDDFVNYTDHGVVLPSGGTGRRRLRLLYRVRHRRRQPTAPVLHRTQPGASHPCGRSPGGLSRNERR